MPRLENEGFKNFMHNSLAVAITVDSVLDYGLLPFRLQLHVATLQLDIFVYNCMWQHYMGLRFERWLPAFPFTNACDHAVLLSGMSGFSGKPSGELLWKADSGGHYWT